MNTVSHDAQVSDEVRRQFIFKSQLFVLFP